MLEALFITNDVESHIGSNVFSAHKLKITVKIGNKPFSGIRFAFVHSIAFGSVCLSVSVSVCLSMLEPYVNILTQSQV